ncbi:MAG TPA: sigma 54-interacting transcriptional regulator [bacterium]|nr:sigma 54-interacting transcriptional regulator [bacterium]
MVGHYVFEWNAATRRLEGFNDIDRLLGYEPGGFPRDFEGYLSQVHPDDLARVRDAIEKSAAGTSAFHKEYRLRKKTGDYVHFITLARPVLGENGDVERWVVVHADVTEQRKMEEALSDAENKFRSLVNESAYGYVEFDLEGCFIFFNQRAEEMAGYKLDADKPMNFRDFIVPEDLGRAVTDLGKVEKEPNAGPREYRIRRNDGAIVDLQVNTLPLRKGGKLCGFQSTVLDITARKNSEHAVQESERRYRLVVENLVDVLWILDAAAKPVFISPSIKGLLGYTPEEAGALGPTGLLTAESHQRWHQLFLRTVEALDEEKKTGVMPDVPRMMELEMVHKNGARVWAEASWIFRRDPAGNFIGFQGVFHDITRRREAEEAIKLSQERLRAQYNAIPVPTYTWQKEGDDFTLVDYNAAAVAITRGRIRDYIRIKASELYADDPAIRADLDRCFRERESFERAMIYNYQCLEQQKYLVVKYAFVVPDQVIAHTEDQTERWKALQALAELEQRQREKLSAEVKLRRSRDYAEPEGAGFDLHQFPSPAMRRVLEEAMLAARSHGNVLLLGKSGVGKTYLAGWIHQRSARADGPFFDINCTTLAPSLIESELFGHEAGAFTGSKGRKRGLFELAHGGTLFLDEIGDLPLDLQAKLLNFLDTREFMRVGGETKIRVDARIIVATNRDLASLVQEKRFREDLYYRLNVLAIMVPLLKERKEDMPLLAAAILEKIARDMGLKKAPELGPEALAELMHYDWPGNVRELRNILERVVLRNENKEIINGISTLKKQRKAETRAPEPTPEDEPPPSGSNWNFDQAVDRYMRKMIVQALAAAGSKTEAARLLGISRHALHRYIRKFRINGADE